MTNKPKLVNYRCIPDGLWLQDIDRHPKVTNQRRSEEAGGEVPSVSLTFSPSPLHRLEEECHDVHYVDYLADSRIPNAFCVYLPAGAPWLNLRWWGVSASSSSSLALQEIPSAWCPYVVPWLAPHLLGISMKLPWKDSWWMRGLPRHNNDKNSHPRMTYLPRGRSRRKKRWQRAIYNCQRGLSHLRLLLLSTMLGKLDRSLGCKVTSIKGIFDMAPIYTLSPLHQAQSRHFAHRPHLTSRR